MLRERLRPLPSSAAVDERDEKPAGVPDHGKSWTGKASAMKQVSPDGRHGIHRRKEGLDMGGRYLRRQSEKPRKRRKTRGEQIKSFADVQAGDYVVHESHGIGKFVGIEQLTVQGVRKDYLKVKYAGEDSLYIPVDQLGMLQKYIGGDGVAPRLNKLSGGEWKATKARARAAVDDMAQELIRVSAARMRSRKVMLFRKIPYGSVSLKTAFLIPKRKISCRCIEEINRTWNMMCLWIGCCVECRIGKTEVAARAF